MKDRTPSRNRKKPSPSQPRPQLDGPRSALAVASFVLSLLSLILGPFGCIPGIICGHLAKARLRRDARLRGDGFARAGLVIGYLGLVWTIGIVGFAVLSVRQGIRASAVGGTASSASGSGGTDGNAEVAPMIVGPAPVSVKVQNFRSRALGQKGGFTTIIENRTGKPVVRFVWDAQYRDADGLSEKDVPTTLLQTLAPNGRIEHEDSDFFMLPTTRSVTVSLREVTFADGGEWNPFKAALAAADPGPFNFAGQAPVVVEVKNFRPLAAGEKAGYTLIIENRSRQVVNSLLLRVEYRDADGVSEKDVSDTLQKTFPPNFPIEDLKTGFFMLPTTRSVTVSVQEVTFADGSEWSRFKAALAAAAPGSLSFAGHAAPASAEVIRFRPNTAKKGNVASRLVNHSNKAILKFDLDIVCLDATGKRVDTVRASVRAWGSFGGPDSGIEPGGTYEFSEDVPRMNEAARSATFVVRELIFVGGEKWVPAKE